MHFSSSRMRVLVLCLHDYYICIRFFFFFKTVGREYTEVIKVILLSHYFYFEKHQHQVKTYYCYSLLTSRTFRAHFKKTDSTTQSVDFKFN